jgi:S-adenosylhomocysteine hydrolase
MTLSVILSKENDCDIEIIIKVVNSLQLFFVAEHIEPAISLPSKPIDDPFLNVPDFERALKVRGILQMHFPEQRSVVLTSRHADVIHTTCMDQPIIISDAGRDWQSKKQRSLWFATEVVRLGIKTLINHECRKARCICSRHEGFHFLCGNCERLLRALDYRDAIAHLRGAMQWLNEQLKSKQPNLSRPPVPQISARLRLAEHYAKQNLKSRPFRGKAVLMVLHFLSDLVPFVEALNKMGAAYSDMILIAKPYPYPKRDFVSHHLQQLGVHIYRATDEYPVQDRAKDILRQLSTTSSFKRKRFVVIEDGGYFTPLLHRRSNRQLLKHCIGAVEQTTKGIRRNKHIKKIGIPILSVAKCTFKSRYEAPEIGRVTIQNITRFVPNIKLSGGHAIVFGFGDIGAQVAYQLNKAFNMGVSIVDNDALKVMEARHRRDFVTEAHLSFSKLSFRDEAVLVVGTTGEQSISRDVLKQLPRGCVIVSTSSDRVEIDMDALKQMSGSRLREIEEGKTVYSIQVKTGRRSLTLLAEGYPINFYGSESLPNATIDPIMTLLLLCGIELCKGRTKVHAIDEEVVNKIVQKSRLIEIFLLQSKYRGS